jgi:hypothetical protein
MNHKLSPDSMLEVNQLMESAQDDLEGVLFRLVAEREAARDAILRARAAGISSVNYSATEAGNLARWVDSRFEGELPPPDEWVEEWVSALPNTRSLP